MSEDKKKVYEKIAKVSKSVGVVSKDAKNSFHGYQYQSWESVLAAVKSACVEHGLVIIPNDTEYQVIPIVTKSGEKNTLLISYRFEVCDSESGESISATWTGQATLDDDKTVNKCGTAAYKYFVLKLFQIAVKGDDSDTDAHSGYGAEQEKKTEASGPGYTIPQKNWQSFANKCKKAGLDPVKVQEEIHTRKIQDGAAANSLIDELAKVSA